MTKPLLEVTGLTKYFPLGNRAPSHTSHTSHPPQTSAQIRAVDHISFHIHPGETLGLVGESGCGKTTTGRMVLRLIEPTAGKMTFRANGHELDLLQLKGAALRQARRHLQLVFQDPYSSLDPRMTAFDSIAEPLRAHRMGTRADIEARVYAVADAVGLQGGMLRRYPHAFSGGQRQRIGIARALAPEPRLIVCDEPVSALDVSVQAQIVNLLKDLQEQLGVAYLFVAHDLAVVENISHRVAIMYAGRIVETAPTHQMFHQPRHPYTQALLAAAPQPDPTKRATQAVLEGEPADPARLPTGCAFHPRCPRATELCHQHPPALESLEEDHFTACHCPIRE